MDESIPVSWTIPYPVHGLIGNTFLTQFVDGNFLELHGQAIIKIETINDKEKEHDRHW